ncbi:MAG: hypothetical protein ACU837_02965 [Gammaproteobacteria bacterium]
MSPAQRELVNYWIFMAVVIVVGTGISLSDIGQKQLAILCLTVAVVVYSLFQDFSYYTGYGIDREKLGEFVERHLILKVWLVGFCALILPFILYQMFTAEDDSLLGYLYFSSFALLIGPVVVFSEIERYRSLRE